MFLWRLARVFPKNFGEILRGTKSDACGYFRDAIRSLAKQNFSGFDAGSLQVIVGRLTRAVSKNGVQIAAAQTEMASDAVDVEVVPVVFFHESDGGGHEVVRFSGRPCQRLSRSFQQYLAQVRTQKSGLKRLSFGKRKRLALSPVALTKRRVSLSMIAVQVNS